MDPERSFDPDASIYETHEPLFRPKLFSTLKHFSWSQTLRDCTSGVIVGIVALPLAIAFAIASGVTPDRGLVTAIIGGFFIAALGGSRVQIGGPTGAFVVIIYKIVADLGVDGLIACTLLAGLMMIAFGALRLGTVIKFIPYPLTIGFTSGIAVVIFSSQIRDLLGLQTGALPGDFLEKWGVYLHHIASVNWWACGMALTTMLIIFLWPRVSRRIPGSIIAILGLTALAYYFQLPVETIGSRFGAMPSGFPAPHWPALSLASLKTLVGPAFTIALLGSIEALLSATVADGMIEGRHRSNTELIGQGIANIACALVGGIPATGAIARTATNVRSGARTPIAGIVHSLTLLAILLAFGRYAAMIPLSVLAGVLVVVCYHMSEWHTFRALLKAPRMDVAVLLTTFLLTVFIDLTVAVEVGMLLSLILFMKRMTDVTRVREVTNELENPASEQQLRSAPDAVSSRVIPPGVAVFEAEGAFFFGVATRLRDSLQFGREAPRVLVLRMRHVLALDATGLRAIEDLQQSCKKFRTHLLIEGVHAQPLFAMTRAGLLAKLDAANVLPGLDAALARANALL